jgi:hypothetical protein
LDLQVLRAQQVLKELVEPLVIQDLLEQRVQFPGQRVQQVLKDLEVLVERPALLVLQEHKDLQDQQVQQDLLVRHQRCLDLPDQLEMLELLALLAQPERLGLQVRQVLKEFVALLALLDRQEILDLLV